MRKSLLGRSAYIVSIAILIGLNGLHDPREASALSITEIKVVSTPHPDTAHVDYLQPDDPQGNIYTVGDTIRFEVKFDHTVRVDGVVRLGIYVGDQWRGARHQRRPEQGSGTFYSTEFFEYKVVEEDRDEDGIRVIRGNIDNEGRRHGIGGSGTITHSSNGDTLNATYSGLPDQSGHKVNGSLGAWITKMEITSTPASGKTYRYGEDVEIDMTFSHPVRIGTENIPYLPVHVDEIRSDGETLSMQRTAKYKSGSGTRTLRFSMTVASYYKDNDGFEIWKKTRGDTTGTLANRALWTKDHDVRVWLWHDKLGPDSDHKLNGKPYIKGVAITSSPEQGNSYRPSEVIQVTVTFDQKVKVEGSVGMKWEFNNGPNSSRIFQEVPYASGSGTESLVFEHTVTAADSDTNGLSVVASGNGGWTGDGTIWSVVPSVFLPNNRVPADRSHNGISNDSDHKVKGFLAPLAPTISSIAITSDAGESSTYAIGDSIEVTVTFSEDITITGTPQLELDIGGTAKTASYDSVDGSAAVFIYVVQEGDSDEDGIGIGADKLTLNGGTIQDGNGNAANLAHEAVATDAGHKVDGVYPKFDTADISSDGTYINVNFTEYITVPEILRTISRSVNVDLGQFYIAVMSVTVDGDLVKPSSATINDAQLRLNLAASVTQSQRVNVAYDNIFARDAVGLFIDRVGNPLQNFSSTPVSNVSNVPDAEESDVKDLVLSLTELRVTEGESGTYTVKLEAQPSADVTVNLSSSSTKLSVSPESLTFTTDNWNTAQTVTLSASQDDDELNYWVLVTHTGSGGDYDGAEKPFLVVIDDDDD